jgi:hypothetical protein
VHALWFLYGAYAEPVAETEIGNGAQSSEMIQERRYPYSDSTIVLSRTPFNFFQQKKEMKTK